MLDTLNEPLMATVPVPLKFTHARHKVPISVPALSLNTVGVLAEFDCNVVAVTLPAVALADAAKFAALVMGYS